jgi:RecB family exonuclease
MSKNKYNPRRTRNLYKGQKNYRLSRSKIQQFLDCPRCFYFDRKLGIQPPPLPNFSLNNAVDHLLKTEFDALRSEQKAHKIFAEYKLNFKPFKHPKLDVWRENFQGITYEDKASGFTISGAIDDLWITPENKIVIVDYKATSRSWPMTDVSKVNQSNLRQLDIYSWLFEKNGFDIYENAYLLYCNARRDLDKFAGKLEFTETLIAYQPDSSWVDQTLLDIRSLLDKSQKPASNQNCSYCLYCQAMEHENSVQTLF